MNVKYNIPELIAMAAYINYQPAVAGAVNRLLTAKNETEYSKALKDAQEATLGYKVNEVYEHKDYGTNPDAQFEGLPIFQPLTIEDSTGIQFQLPAAVVNFNRVKNIKITTVQGRDTSIAEFINKGDYSINVSGILNKKGWGYPIEQVTNLAYFMDLSEPLKVSHEILNTFGIYEIIVLDYTIPKTPFINCQPFSFNAKNDEPLPLMISDTPSNPFV